MAVITHDSPCLVTFWSVRSSAAVDRIDGSAHSSRDGKPLRPVPALPGEEPSFLYAVTREHYYDCMTEHYVRQGWGEYIPF